ncbi:undecaprenol kinase domain protein [Leptospira interrogans serovar Lora str. TE 1992]|uniref:Undecaprenyl-diphosphatase n=1 Tax=Leptospira interrogans serovar Lora str. TE 1992 TaxID=1193028 RepID=M3DI63_LEPIR|nr:undecaprenol kinase domain protein [Leptospira interrogans serovar Lora str. TE 1992]
MALIPGMSRSAATIITARFLGKDTKSSAEFSFFLCRSGSSCSRDL